MTLGSAGILEEDRSALPLDPTAPDDETLPALELYDIVKTWKAAGRVLDNVDLVVEPGNAVHLFGRNGCGKTTLLRIAIGLIKPEDGIVSSGGLSPRADRRRYQQRIGFLAAGDRALYARMTVRDHIRFWARLNFVPRARERQVVEQAIERFGLTELAGRRVDRISMGQRQRTRLAGSFVHDPSVVLLDEPRNSLDDDGIALLVQWARGVIDRGGCVVWCSPHGESTELDFTDRYLLEAGKLRSR